MASNRFISLSHALLRIVQPQESILLTGQES